MSDLKIILSSPPQSAGEAARLGPVSVMAYRIGRGFHLYRTPLPRERLEIMDVDCAGFTGYGPQEALAGELIRECGRMGYSGMSLDLPRPTPQLMSFCRMLASAARFSGLTLYLPEPYAAASDTPVLLVPAQNITGTYEARLKSLSRRYGPGRLAIELERVHTDFPLPARTGRGSVLTEQAAARLPLGTHFYSPSHLANYAAYVSSGRAHLVMWDDADTLREKLEAARRLGLHSAFLYYPHVADIAGKIFDVAP